MANIHDQMAELTKFQPQVDKLELLIAKMDSSIESTPKFLDADKAVQRTPVT